MRLGVAGDGYVQVVEGISARERIVTSSQFLIDAESNLRTAVAAMSALDAEQAPAPGAGPSEPGTKADAGGGSPGAGSPAPRASGGEHAGMQMGDAGRP